MMFDLRWLSGEFTIVRLTSDAPIPSWASGSDGFVSISRTADELSIIARNVPPDCGVEVESGWIAFRIVGQLDFSMTGVLASISTALADAGISVVAVSTFDTDYFLVKHDRRAAAMAALSGVAAFE